MAEIIGKEAVKSFIERSKMKRFKIYGSGDDMKKSAPRWACSEGSPIEEFDAWSDMVDSQGLNVTGYKIKCYDTEEKDGVEKADGGRGVSITFQLNTPAPRTIGAPQTGVLTEERLVAILAGQKPQVDVEATIEKVAHKYQMEMLTTKLEYMQKESARNMANLREEMQDMLEDEEEEERHERKMQAMVKVKEAEMKGYNDLAKIGAQVLGEIKNVVYEFTGRGNAIGNGRALAVGKRMGDAASPSGGWQPPVSDKPGELPLFAPEGKVNIEDQVTKLNTYTKLMLAENDVMGDDAILLYKLLKDMPDKFSEIIGDLRKNVQVDQSKLAH